MDPELMHAADPGEFARSFLGWTPGARQLMVLRTSPRRVILNCSRPFTTMDRRSARRFYAP